MTVLPDLPPAMPQKTPPAQATRLQETARELEAAFLAEMLKSAGIARPSESFGGGAGEEAFSSFMVRTYADQMAAAGGLGLSEAIVRALAEDTQ